MRLLVLLVALVLGGCVAPYMGEWHIADPARRARLREAVIVYPAGQAGRYVVVTPVEATSCGQIETATATPADAVDRLRAQAAAAGAWALTNVTCDRRSMTFMCWSAVKCWADAIKPAP